MLLFARLAALLLLLAAPVTLRYRFTPGQALRFRIVQETVTTVRVGEEPPHTQSQQTTTMIVQRRVTSASGGGGVVEEKPLDGISQIQNAEGKSQQVVSPITHLYTYDALGRCLKTQRRVPAGVRDPGDTFLQGLSFTVPQKPVKPGDTWTSSTTTLGVNAKPIAVRYTSRYVETVSRAGHSCARISTAFSSAFKVEAGADAAPADGKITGTVTNYLALDLGVDVEVDLNLTLTVTPPAKSVITTKIHARQVLQK